MTQETLKRANQIIKEMDDLNQRISKYDLVIRDVKIDVERGETTEHIYHNNHNFIMPTTYYLLMLENLKSDCDNQVYELCKEFKAL